MKKVFIGIGIGVVAIIIVVIISNFRFNYNLKSRGLVGIGKELTVEITQNSDYTIFENSEELSIWNEKERNKMTKYMKENNLKLKSGLYTINTSNTFEKALEIFKFE